MHALMAATAQAIAHDNGQPERLAGWTHQRAHGASAAVLRAQTDERLMALAGGGCEAAFEALVRRYRAPLQRFARRFVADALAEDVVQQAFVELWTKLTEGFEIHNLRAWLFRVVRNAALNCIRRDARHGEQPHELGGGEPADVVYERASHLRQALHAIVSLPSRQRDVVLHAIDGSSRSQIAVAMGITDAAAGQMLHRARASLRSAVSGLVPWPLVTWAIGLRRHGARAANAAQVAAVGATRAPMLARCGAALVLLAGGAGAPLAIIHSQHSQSAAHAHSQVPPQRALPAPAGLLSLVAMPGAMQRTESALPGVSAPSQQASVTPPPTTPAAGDAAQAEPAPAAAAGSSPASEATTPEGATASAADASAAGQPGQATEQSSETPPAETAAEPPPAEATPVETPPAEAPDAETAPVEATPAPAGI
jgi:RNA polymerase sigma factor (sigma-70 family)